MNFLPRVETSTADAAPGEGQSTVDQLQPPRRGIAKA